MKLHKIKPGQKLKSFLKIKPHRNEIDKFKINLSNLFMQIDESESEEFHKNLITKFLSATYYEPNYFINTKGRNDLVIHNGKDANTTVGVIIEAKKSSNKAEMLREDNLNTKAFHELLLYYLRERITLGNLEIKHLIATNTYEWFIFDAHLFEKEFAQNKKLIKQFQDFEAKRLSGEKTDFFYKEIAEPAVKALNSEIIFTHFDIRDYKKFLKKDDKKLIALYKIFSPEHLLKLPFVNDSNSLDKSFYTELLHIIGLAEIKKGSKKLIERKIEKERNAGSLLENAIQKLDSLDKIQRLKNQSLFGNNYDEQIFNVSLELSITWINRILFLKLLEAQIITYHKGDKEFSFFNLTKVKSFDDLDDLFFAVLAKLPADRIKNVKEKFANVPYLNSSLFEPTEIEQETIFISNLGDDKTLPILSTTVLKDTKGKKRKGKINTLAYIFEFLNAYDFTSEGVEDIQEESKTLINASVLGLIFEKINGYKDGSFFTPGFITMYMCRETIRRAVLQKFNTYLENRQIDKTNGVSKTPLLRGAGGVSKTPLLRGAGGVSKRRTIIPYNPKLKEIARKLRNNSTKSEIHLWGYLKGKFQGKYDFHRQKPLDNFIADFFCSELNLVIEVDGITHEWDKTKLKDFVKERKLNELGINVLRFTDNEVLKNTEGTVKLIVEYISCFENNDFSDFNYDNTPLNPLSRGDFAEENDSIPIDSLSRGDFAEENDSIPIDSLSRGEFAEGNERRKFNTIDDLYESIGDNNLFSKKEANKIINSLKICDPAVGSGHFLVSALNEIIAIKSELAVLIDNKGKSLRDYTIEVVNDELIITDDDGDLFEYHFNNKEKQRVQETLFHEKQTIIENCLFGVDINHNSVKICRLRLWIELLKNSYYKKPDFKELETLPNIDINIKCGNSLISRFPLDADIKKALKKSNWTIDSYRDAVMSYRNAQNKEQKRKMVQLIADIKSDFRTTLNRQGKEWKKIETLKGELYNLLNQIELLELSDAKKKSNKTIQVKLEKAITKQTAVIEAIESSKIYENAFEWRFEFPEVLNNDGEFIGFDVIIGNPPYISIQKMKKEQSSFESQSYETYERTGDIYALFYEKGIKLLKPKGNLCYITSNKWMRTAYGKSLRAFFLTQNPILLIDCGPGVFENATVDVNIMFLQKCKRDEPLYGVKLKPKLANYDIVEYISSNQNPLINLNEQAWFVGSKAEQKLKEKIESIGKPLQEWDVNINRGILTGLNEAFIIDTPTKEKLCQEDPKSIEILKPILRGRDIKRFGYKWDGLWIIATFPSLNVDINKYPAIEKYLLDFGKERLEQVGKKLSDGTKSRKKTSNEWFETQDQIGYYKEMNEMKIAWGNLALSCQFSIVDAGIYINAPSPLIDSCDYYFLAVLNSTLADNYIRSLGVTRNGGYFEYKPMFVEKLPIPIISKDAKQPFVKLVDKILDIKKVDPNIDTSALENEIDSLVYKLYDLTDEEIDIIENS